MDESEIPIDIHTNKLLDWLISRRHVSRDWSNNIMKVREKINNAIQDMPEHKDIAALLSGSYINYYHCKSIVNILKETESNTKNLFGQYGSQRMKDWQEVIKLYEKDNLYLGEVASLLIRTVSYEVPALKKNIQKNNNSQKELEKRESDYEKSHNIAKNEFNALCKQLGIKGNKIKKELVEKCAELPEMNKKVINSLFGIKDGIDHYQNVVTSVCLQERLVLPLLKYLIENGDTTVYQWKYKKVPATVATPQLLLDDDDEQDTNAEDDAIDFGVDDIDFNTGDQEIDWGISTDDAELPQEIEEVPSEARGDEARTILGNIETRNQFVNELMELEAFLKMRHHELSSRGDVMSLPAALSIHDDVTLAKWLLHVQNVLRQATNPTSIHYLNITTNYKYLDQLTAKLKQKLTTMEKLKAAAKCVQERRKEIQELNASIQPKINVLIEATRKLQDTIELDISHRYNGRPVNLIGGVNLL